MSNNTQIEDSSRIFHFHVNPPSKDEKRATFTGIITDTDLNIGIATCSKKDQFSRKKGRVISTGRAVSKPLFVVNVSNVAERDLSDHFVQQCRMWAEENGYNTKYPRRRKKNKNVVESSPIQL